jgi:hypothetical protein
MVGWIAARLLALTVLAVMLGVAAVGQSKLVVAGACVALLAVIALVRVDVLWAALVVVGLIAYGKAGNAWTAMEGFVVALVLVREVALGRRPWIPAFLTVYCGWFLVVAAHTAPDSAAWHALLKYMLVPALAIVTAVAARDVAVRRRIVVVLLLGATAETVAVCGQVAAAHFHPRTDTIVGTLGGSNANVLGLVMVPAAVVCFALAVEKVWRPRLLMLLAILVGLCGVLSQSRATLVFLPAGFGAVLLTYGFSRYRSRGARRALALLLPVTLGAPLIVAAYHAMYPTGLSSLTSVSRIEQYLLTQRPGGALPGYGVQLQLAVDQAISADLPTALTGSGLGTSSVTGVDRVASGPGYTVTSAMTATKTDDLYPFVSARARSGGIWTGRLLIETGWIGVALFVALLGWIVLLACRTRNRAPPGSLDRGILAALPGLAAVTLLGAFYASVLSVPPYILFFSSLVGVGLAINRAMQPSLRGQRC